MLVGWWSGAVLAAFPTTATFQGSSGAPDFTITTAKAGSVVSWCSNDASVQTGTRAYITTSGTPVEEFFFNQGLSTYTFVYQPAATAGAQTVGETAPDWPAVGRSCDRAAAAPVASGLAMVGIA